MRFGVVTGLAMEAGRLRGAGGLSDEFCRIAVGAGPAAAAAASALVADGVPALVSIGLAGGLAPALDAGDLVLATEIVAPDGTRHACDAAWRRSLSAALGDEVREGPLAGADMPATTPEEKRALAAGTAALAVDTESHHVARVAAGAGLRFAALRVVIDRVDDPVPAAAARAYGADGRIRPLRLLWGLLQRPGDLPALLRLARQSRRALERLGGVGRLGAGLAPLL